MERDPSWKQESPWAQSVALTQAIEGWLLNLEDGSSTPERVLEGIAPVLVQLKKLHAVALTIDWPEGKRIEHWKQDTPRQQAASIVQAIQGWLFVLERNPSKGLRVFEQSAPFVFDLKRFHDAVMPRENF